MIKVDKSLFETLTNHFIKSYEYTPNTARVYSYLNFDYAKEGISFDQIVQYLQISKSTASTALNFLMDKKQVTFFYKENDRKRYFTINQDFIRLYYQQIYDKLVTEKIIFRKLAAHKKGIKIQNKDLDKKFEILDQAIEYSIQNLAKTIKNLDEI